MTSGRLSSALAAALLGGSIATHRVTAQTLSGSPIPHGAFVLDTLLRTPGPPWTVSHSRHFVLYVERDSLMVAARLGLLDSLESAWRHAVSLVETPLRAGSPVRVFVTASRTRFSRITVPGTKGLTTMMPGGTEMIILIHNDSVRAYTRHEVMHVVAPRAWGRWARSAVWLVEGFATFADGQCQGSTVMAVGRDLLLKSPDLTVRDVTNRAASAYTPDERARAYVLAGTLAGYLLESRGIDGVRAVWQGRDSLAPSSRFLDDPTTGWRAYVMRMAGVTPGLDSAAFRRAGCG